MATVIRHRYSARERVALRCILPSLTKQAPKEECDINVIMRRYAQTGVAPGTPAVASYGDFYGPEDYLEAQLTLKASEAQFQGLPATVRERFHNSPMQLLQFVQDRANLAEARKLGLLREEPPAPPAPTPPAPPAA